MLIIQIATISNQNRYWNPGSVLIWICNLSNIELNISPNSKGWVTVAHLSFPIIAISHWVEAMGPANRLYQIAKRSFIKSDQFTSLIPGLPGFEKGNCRRVTGRQERGSTFGSRRDSDHPLYTLQRIQKRCQLYYWILYSTVERQYFP